jgi:2-polyprenyl-3-methyl-5-hydroxy-6-metoxy-1,4-benzoquinol methylase
MSDRQYGVPGRWDIVRCGQAGCGVLWLDPVPVPEDLHLAYRDYYTHGSSGTWPPASGPASVGSTLRKLYQASQDAHLAHRLGYPSAASVLQREVLRRLLEAWPGRAAAAESLVLHLPAQAGGRALDVGCGNGHLVAALRARGWDAEGIDVDETAVADARRRGLPVRLGHLDTLAIPPGSMDAVTLRHVVEHVHDPGALLASCHRVLRSGGRLAIVTPNAGSALLRKYGADWIGFDLPRHLTIFNRRALDRLVSESGFTIERSFTSVTGANVAAVAARALRRSGAHDIRSRTPLPERVRAELVQQWVSARLRVDDGTGEEIVVVARRADDGGS